jgi:SAF domain
MSAARVVKPPSDLLSWAYWLIFVILVPVVALWMANKPAQRMDLPVLARDLPAYHVIVAQDIITSTVDAGIVLNDTVHDPHTLVAHYTRDPIAAGHPIPAQAIAAVAEQRLISNTLAIALLADRATILGGQLRAGDIVRLATVPLTDTASAPAIVFDRVLVLDVKSSNDAPVVILAIPADRLLEYLARIRSAAVVLARPMK